jgi:BirA family biotin operon repressor/biotin-[acetyl-CoA-carboxylase] ligase
MLAAVAVNKAIKKVTKVSCGIKWPNDILCGNKKLVGILTEMTAEIDAINYIVIGMGINVNISKGEFPPELDNIATSLAQEAGGPISRLDLLAAILAELESVYQRTLQEGFGPVLEEWRAESITLGRMVDVLGIGRQFAGKAVDIASDGGLLVATDAGIEKVVAGDVSIRAKPQEEQ